MDRCEACLYDKPKKKRYIVFFLMNRDLWNRDLKYAFIFQEVHKIYQWNGTMSLSIWCVRRSRKRWKTWRLSIVQDKKWKNHRMPKVQMLHAWRLLPLVQWQYLVLALLAHSKGPIIYFFGGRSPSRKEQSCAK